MDTKHLLLSIPEPKEPKAPPKKKVIVESDDWAVISGYLDAESQKRVLQTMVPREVQIHLPPERVNLHLERAIRTKLAGYKSQDVAKELYDPNQFISYDQTLAALLKSDLLCFYCRTPVLLFYEFVREPRQWSLERIDNTFGHNTDNVEIACLDCNVRRKTMYHERFVFTKQAVIVKHDS